MGSDSHVDSPSPLGFDSSLDSDSAGGSDSPVFSYPPLGFDSLISIDSPATSDSPLHSKSPVRSASPFSPDSPLSFDSLSAGSRPALQNRPLATEGLVSRYKDGGCGYNHRLINTCRVCWSAKKKKQEKHKSIRQWRGKSRRKQRALKSHHPHCFLNITLSAVAAAAADSGYSLARYLLNTTAAAATASPDRNYFSCNRRRKVSNFLRISIKCTVM